MEQLHNPNLSHPPRREFEGSKAYAARRSGGVNCITLLERGEAVRARCTRAWFLAHARALLVRKRLHIVKYALRRRRGGTRSARTVERQLAVTRTRARLAVFRFRIEQT